MHAEDSIENATTEVENELKHPNESIKHRNEETKQREKKISIKYFMHGNLNRMELNAIKDTFLPTGAILAVIYVETV